MSRRTIRRRTAVVAAGGEGGSGRGQHGRTRARVMLANDILRKGSAFSGWRDAPGKSTASRGQVRVYRRVGAGLDRSSDRRRSSGPLGPRIAKQFHARHRPLSGATPCVGSAQTDVGEGQSPLPYVSKNFYCLRGTRAAWLLLEPCDTCFHVSANHGTEIGPTSEMLTSLPTMVVGAAAKGDKQQTGGRCSAPLHVSSC